MSEEPKDKRGGGTAMPQPHGGAIGNPPHERTAEKAEMVKRLAGLQISQEEIGIVIGCSPDTIQRHYGAEFAEGRVTKGIKLRTTAYDVAFGVLNDPDDASKGWKHAPDPKMIQFLLERQFGMVPEAKLQHTGKDGGPMVVDISGLSDEAKRELAGVRLNGE